MFSYVIADRHGGFLRQGTNGNYKIVKDKLLASTWASHQKASNVLQSCVNKNLRNRYHVKEVDIPERPKQSQPVHASNIERLPKELPLAPVDDKISVWEGRLRTIGDNLAEVDRRKEKLEGELSEADKEISDIYHYVELANFNCYQGWLACKALKNSLQKRRKIKDELYVLRSMGECKLNLADVYRITDEISSRKNRCYRPRAIEELFQ